MIYLLFSSYQELRPEANCSPSTSTIQFGAPNDCTLFSGTVNQLKDEIYREVIPEWNLKLYLDTDPTKTPVLAKDPVDYSKGGIVLGKPRQLGWDILSYFNPGFLVTQVKGRELLANPTTGAPSQSEIRTLFEELKKTHEYSKHYSSMAPTLIEFISTYNTPTIDNLPHGTAIVNQSNWRSVMGPVLGQYSVELLDRYYRMVFIHSFIQSINQSINRFIRFNLFNLFVLFLFLCFVM